ncbi:hypothetical protein ILUMI_21545 [Ignelater luminosus]|uniref:Uncharacterized protein n=1 Tax=Ignelater luminosus TaxID=2038154 RepID=A0A8K0G3L6_IGNLU|nr:hypothetical protein ILUMI_21545 [Ignelater luminosus]
MFFFILIVNTMANRIDSMRSLKYSSLPNVAQKVGDKFSDWQYYKDSIESNEWPRCRPRYLVCASLIILIIICILVAYFLGAFNKDTVEELIPPNPRILPKPSHSTLHTFKKAAVCADGPPCAEIGKGILERNGSAVDAAIAALFCNGIVNMQSMGLGGGFLMTIYIRESKSAYTLNAREAAPLKATPNMFKDQAEKAKHGALAVGVPGELRGYWTAHKRFGKLPWKELILPSIELCEKGYNMSLAQSDVLSGIRNDTLLREWFLEPNGKYKKTGSVIKPIKLCETLKVIAENGGDDLYNGTLSKVLLQDIKDLGGIITQEDLDNYTARWEDSISTEFRSGDHLYTMPPPASGVLLGFMLNILDGYNFTKDSIDGADNTILTYHRIIEAFKYAYAKRTELGDSKYVNITQLLQNLTSAAYANQIRSQIKDNSTSTDPLDYGAVFYNQPDHGTAHISVLADNGDAVSVTSTVNLYFGAGITSKNTGIILNSGMDDFSSPGFVNYFGLPGSPNNAIAPGKRALSSISPTIITDKNGDVKIVIGAAGGTKITTAVALVIMRNLWFGQNIKEAVDAPRFHHQLYPMEVSYEYGNIQQVISGLEALGHKMKRYRDRGSVICALLKKNDTIYANADHRKGGDVYGLN